MTVVAPFSTSYTNREPYLTVAEWKAAPTGVDPSNLIVGGTQAEQDAQLANQINRASSWIDVYCCGSDGTLCATVNTETGRIRPDRNGVWHVHPKFAPLLELRAFQLGSSPATLQPTTLSSSTVWVEEETFVVVGPAAGLTTSQGPLQFGAGNLVGDSYAQWTYVNGWPNTTLSASVAASASSILPTSVVGIYPGSALTLYDPTNGDDPLIVASTYVAGTASVPLVSPLAFSHAAGSSVSALPPVLKQAAILVTSAFILDRGDSPLVLATTGGPSDQAAKTAKAVDPLDKAKEMLAAGGFRIIVG